MSSNIKKIRSDLALIECGLAKDLIHARSLISCGLVFLGDKKIEPNSVVDIAEVSSLGFRIKDSKDHVSRGAVKLQTVFNSSNIDVSGFECIDVGSSTGGFTEILLSKGAKLVYAVDVGKNILDYKLRSNPKVVTMEGINARFLDEEKIVLDKIKKESLDLAVMDLSFISLRLVIPKVLPFIKKQGIVIPLVKPQFEVEQSKVEKGGVVKDQEVIKELIEQMKVFFNSNGLLVNSVIPSQLKGPSGNQEYFFMCLKTG